MKKRRSKRSKRSKRSFGYIPNIPLVDNYSGLDKTKLVAGSLLARRVYLDDPAYDKLYKKIINLSVKEVRDDTVIRTIAKFAKDRGHSEVDYNKLKKILIYYNMLSYMSNDLKSALNSPGH